MNQIMFLSLVRLDLLPSTPHPSPADILLAARFMSCPRGELPGGSSADGLPYSLGRTLESGVNPIRSYAFTHITSSWIRDPALDERSYTPISSSLVCRSGLPSAEPALGGEGQQSLRSFGFLIVHHAFDTNRETGRIRVFFIFRFKF